MSIVAVTALMLASAPITVSGRAADTDSVPGYVELSENRIHDALAVLGRRYVDEPAYLINLGTTYVRLNRVAEAQRMYAAAVHSEGRTDLLLADGRVMDSRKAAKLALQLVGSDTPSRALAFAGVASR